MDTRIFTVWDLYFAGLVSMSVHPGHLKEDGPGLSLKRCAEIADCMIAIRNARSDQEVNPCGVQLSVPGLD